MSKGFTIVELLVVMAVLAIAGIILTETFFRSLSGGNKAEVVSKIKQNGQIAMDVMDKTIRNADTVVCPYTTVDGTFTSPDVVVVLNTDGTYSRFRFFAESSTENGRIEQDTPTAFSATICELTDPAVSPTALTDINTRNGVSFLEGSIQRNKKSGFKDTVSIEFELGPGIETAQGIFSEIDPVVFKTTVQLR